MASARSARSLTLALLTVLMLGSACGDARSDHSTTVKPRVVWRGGFETGDFSQWEAVLQHGPGSATIVRDPVASGKYAAKFVLGPERSQDFSRIEAHEADPGKTGGAYGSLSDYSWAEYVPAATRFAPHASFNHLVQWHPEAPCTGGSLAVNGLASPSRLILVIRGGAILKYGGGCQFAYERTFDLGPVPRNRWLRFQLEVRWSADPGFGFVELWENGEPVVPRTSLATATPGVNVYVRQGLYRFRCNCRTVVYGDGMTVSTG